MIPNGYEITSKSKFWNQNMQNLIFSCNFLILFSHEWHQTFRTLMYVIKLLSLLTKTIGLKSGPVHFEIFRHHTHRVTKTSQKNFGKQKHIAKFQMIFVFLFFGPSKWLKKDPEFWFPTTWDLANMFGRTDLHSDDFQLVFSRIPRFPHSKIPRFPDAAVGARTGIGTGTVSGGTLRSQPDLWCTNGTTN